MAASSDLPSQRATHRLEPGEVHVWLMLEPIEAPSTFLEVLGASEHEELARMAPAPARRFVCGRGLLRYTLARYTGLPPKAWVFERDERGRPELTGAIGPSFNISHTEGLVACAVSEGAVGVDVEKGRRLRDPKALARRFFHPDETAEILQAADAESARASFLRLWTLKEAHAKALGRGIAGQLARVRFPRAQRSGGSRTGSADDEERLIEPLGAGPGWACWHCNPTPAHHLAVAAAGGTRLICHWLDAAGRLRQAPFGDHSGAPNQR